MKAKRLLLCLLFLVLGTVAWADKYYQPGSYRGDNTPRLTLAQAVGAKFMIYNTAIDGDKDRTGFLRNNGVSFDHDKTKERDYLVYNESFVYTMEQHADDDGTVWYAIKSIETGLYVNINGRTDIGSATDAKLYITDWNSSDKKSGVNMENRKYNIIKNGSIEGEDGSTAFVINNGNVCWNGNEKAFATRETGHPYAFYTVNEVTQGAYLEDLHIYSRCDIYSAQVIYGYIRNASQITTNHPYEDEGAISNLLDGDGTTFNVTNRWDNTAGEYHYYQIDLGEPVESLYLCMQRRADGKNAPTKYELQACATADGEYQPIGEYTTNLATQSFYSSDKITLGGSYQYIRIVAKERTTTNFMCMGLSELYVLPGSKVIKDAFDFFDMAAKDLIYTRSTERVYGETVEKYNAQCPEAKLLSGVPLPGNKYRIYADAYYGGVYVNREIMAGSNGLEIKEAGSYHSAPANEKAKYEWYCEETSDGRLIFRNVGDMSKYLGNGTTFDSPYSWEVDTRKTQRHGVPLLNYEMQYLALANDGGFWMGNVKSPQDQTVAPAYVDGDNNPETEAEVVESGLCTDFVFIPVLLTNGEKKITFTANELVQRNVKLLFDTDGDGTEEVHPLPYSRMFVNANKFSKLKLQLLCDEVHEYKGIKVNDDEEIDDTGIAVRNGDIITFDFAKVNDGDVLNIQMEIVKPFEVMSAEFSTTETPSLYLIRNKHQLGLMQQARPNRADDNANIGIGGGESGGPISSQTGTMYYAKFNQRDANMDLVEGTPEWTKTEFEAASLFYFTETEDKDITEYYSVNIHNATTVMKCADQTAWDANGNTWYVQPKRITDNYGYNIGREILNATNNPNNAWCCNHDEGNKIVVKKANDDGTAWEFIEVDDEPAKEMLYTFIEKVARELDATIETMKNYEGVDATKAGYYKAIVGMMLDRASYFKDPENYSGSFKDDTQSDAVAKLLQFAQNIHMIEHEIKYALYELPQLSEDVVDIASTLKEYDQPHWYYISNVQRDSIGNKYYSTFNGDNNAMALRKIETDAEGKPQPKLANMFYVVGEKNSYASVVGEDPGKYGVYKDYPGNNLIIDEYLKVHIHNFMAKEVTLVSKNVQLNKVDSYKPTEAVKQTIIDNLSLKSDEDWSVELEYDIEGNASYNAYGSCLLASTGEPLGDSYIGGFQVYLKDDRSLVIKVNNGDDRYRFLHTQDYFSHIKVVITYSQKKVTLDVYNSLGEKETKTITGVTMNDIEKLTAALPAEGAQITNLSTYQVETMTWKTHQEAEGEENKDEWYILPSSNDKNVGLAIVLGEPNDTKMGWANGEDSFTYVATDLGTADHSTWKFERVTDFDVHIDELIGTYNFEECVIYNKELATLMSLINEKADFIKAQPNGEGEEEAFNEVYYAFLNYTGKMPAELKAPKSGGLYTIRPVAEAETENALLVHVDKSTDSYLTKEVYLGDAIRNDQSYDTRSAWVFEGANGETRTGLKVKNIHTQCYFTALGADKSLVDEQNEATITLAPLGSCTTSFKVGDAYMSFENRDINSVRYVKGTGFWGTALADENIPQGVADIKRGAVYCKTYSVKVETAGTVTVNLEHNGGSHKLNVLGVELVGANDKFYSAYEHGTAGDNPRSKTYNVADVAAGQYTLRCYVCDNSNDGDNVNMAGGYITLTGAVIPANLTNAGTAETKWIVEEIQNPEESLYFETTTNTNGHSTLMLGFPTLIPDEVEAFHGVSDGNMVIGRYISMVSYGEPGETRILPAKSPVILRNTDQSIEPKSVKFYYRNSDEQKADDNYVFGHLYFTIVDCSSFDDVDGDGAADRDVDIYMLNKSGTATRMYRTYENYNAAGEKVTVDGTTNHFSGGHVTCKANKAFMVLSKEESASVASLSFSFMPGTTSIDDVETECGELEIIETIYDLQGRKLSEITHPGIYIVNGKKVLVK